MENIIFDSSNPELIRNLMEKYGNSEYPYHGKNEDGQDVEIHIGKTSVIYKTFQSNGWVRVNYFDENGYSDGETFDGRWK